MRLITQLVEQEEWVDNGGEGGTIRYYNGNLLVNAPDYMHRQINGYSYWPSYTARRVGGQRYVSLNMDSSIGTVDGFVDWPITAVTPGGELVPSGPGGSKAPGTAPKPGGKTKPASPEKKPVGPAPKSPARPGGKK
jgi:hypothetical protein